MIGRVLDWGDVPAWFEAIGTVAAFAVALVIYAQSVADRRLDQARKVSAWCPGGVTSSPDGQVMSVLLRIENLSDEMITEVRTTLLRPDGQRIGQPDGRGDGLDYPVIGPDRRMQLTIDSPRHSGWDDVSWVNVRLEFTGAAGRSWCRQGRDLVPVGA